MFYKASIYIADILEQQNKFASEDKEVYRYGIQQGLNLALNILTTIIIGCLCDMLLPSILFLVCYMPLRSFCGGYHAKTHLRCYIYSVIMITNLFIFFFVLFLSQARGRTTSNFTLENELDHIYFT